MGNGFGFWFLFFLRKTMAEYAGSIFLALYFQSDKLQDCFNSQRESKNTLQHTSWAAVVQSVNLSLPHLPKETTSMQQPCKDRAVHRRCPQTELSSAEDQPTGCSRRQEVWALFPISSFAFFGCLLILHFRLTLWTKGMTWSLNPTSF